MSNTSIDFGIRNLTRFITGPTLTQVFGNGTTTAEGAIAIFAQLPAGRGILETNTTNFPARCRVFGTQTYNNNRSVGLDYVGNNDGTTGSTDFFRNRYCWFGKDQAGTNHLGRYDNTGAEGTGTIRMVRSAVIADDKPRLVLLRREDLGGGSFQFRVTTFTQDGTQEDGDTFTSTFVGNSSATGALTIGSYPPGSSGTMSNWWQGMLSNFVFMRGAAGSDSDWVKIAKGQELSSVFDVSKIIIYRRFQDTSDLSAVSGYTGDVSSAFTLSGSGYRVGTALRPYFDGTSRIKVDEPAHGRVIKALKPGDTTASVTITGTYEGSPSGVEVRLLKSSDSSVIVDWTSGSASAGTWSVTLNSVPANWYYIEARFTNDTSVRHNCRNKVGVGWRPWVWGQSQSVIVIQETTTGSTTPTSDSVSHTFVRSQALFNYKAVTLFPQNAKDIADGAIALGNLLSTNHPNVPIEIVWCNHSGTSVQEWTTDAVPSGGLLKLGSEYAQKLLDVSNEISFFLWLQGTANAGDSAATYKGRMDSLLTGTGSPTWSFSGEFAGDLHLVILGHCRHRDPSNNPASTPGTSHQTMRMDAQYGYVADTTSGITSKQFGAWLHDYKIETASDSTHQDQTDSRGNVRIGKRIAMAIARRAGLSDYSPLATLSLANFGSSAKTTIELTPTLVNGGSLSAIVPATAPTAIDISTDSGSTWSNTGFTTAISGGKVVLTKSSGDWTGITVGNMRVRYAFGWPAAIGNTQLVAETALTDGFLVETRSDTGDTGAALMPVASLTVNEPPPTLTAAVGTFTLTGQAAGLLVGRKITAAVGTFALSGQNADLDYSPDPGPDYTLEANAGLFALTGQAATLRKAWRMVAETGTLTLSGNIVTFEKTGAPGSNKAALYYYQHLGA